MKNLPRWKVVFVVGLWLLPAGLGEDVMPMTDAGDGDWNSLLNSAKTQRNRVVNSIANRFKGRCLEACDNHISTQILNNFDFFQDDFVVDENLLESLDELRTVFTTCHGKLAVFYSRFAMVRNVTLRPFRWSQPFNAGGEDLRKFKGQDVTKTDKEILKPEKGLWELQCSDRNMNIDETLLSNLHMLPYFDVPRSSADRSTNDVVTNFTLAIMREAYANMYHVMLHVYNMFLMLIHFHRQPVNVSILTLDAHPLAEMDQTLTTLFGPIIRIGRLKRPTVFDRLVLSLAENKSPLSKYDKQQLPYVEEFREFVLGRHGLSTSHRPDCTRLKITIVLRRDKVYHPRNMYGRVQRKIMNDAELYRAIAVRLPGACITSVLLETLPMREQLHIIGNTDILVGMHGAGLVHALFLPKSSGLVEMFPYKFKAQHDYYKLFEAIARWRSLHYASWENKDNVAELGQHFTVVDVTSVVGLVSRTVELMCG